MTAIYKYQNESEVTVPDVDYYEIEKGNIIPIHWHAMGTYHDIPSGETKIFASRAVDTPDGIIVIEESRTSLGLLVGHLWILNSNGKKISISPTYYDSNIPLTDQIETGNRVAYGFQGIPEIFRSVTALRKNTKPRYGTGTNEWLYDEDFIELTQNLVITHWHISDVARNYTLRLFVGNNEVYSRTELYRPEYVQIINQCPPNTCPVKCGNKVCCYQSDGVSIEDFLFSESVYQ